MIAQVKLYGPIRKSIGKENMTLEMPAGSTLEDLLKRLFHDHPEMGYKGPEEMISAHMLLVGSQIVKPDIKLTENNEITIFPFVDGG